MSTTEVALRYPEHRPRVIGKVRKADKPLRARTLARYASLPAGSTLFVIGADVPTAAAAGLIALEVEGEVAPPAIDTDAPPAARARRAAAKKAAGKKAPGKAKGTAKKATAPKAETTAELAEPAPAEAAPPPADPDAAEEPAGDQVAGTDEGTPPPPAEDAPDPGAE
jgi:hypothetical protein